jgi:hypothetical protein
MPRARKQQAGGAAKIAAASPNRRTSALAPTRTDNVTLCDALDRSLAAGIVARGELTISVAGIDLVYIGLDALVTSVETARREASAASDRREARAS